MARKDIFGSVMGSSATVEQARDVSGYAVRGASRSIMQSFEELSKSSVVDLDPELVDNSFVADRIGDDEQEFAELVRAIRERGQDSPILVRPHPSFPGRYQTVFGHRRVRVARELGRPVRAVVKQMGDEEHVVAQGQENAARANLSFIERTLFGERMLEKGYSPDIVKSALALDDTTFSKMRSVSSNIAEPIILAVGAAKGIGRDRWWQLAKLMEHPANAAKAHDHIQSGEFLQASSDARFNQLFEVLAANGKAARSTPPKAQESAWAPKDNSVKAKITDDGKVFTLALKSREASAFGTFIAGRLEALFEAFREAQSGKTTGD
ncbi:plasmid partitioning protein RepB [Mesorhizobium sp. CA13]|uniref:plasmid partitioning protein RepB n=1 Tax=unclassified Mesorhizobium TaxID=325217 RepID=UPI00112B3C9A|nr:MULTISPECIES: plasmid partitioning protein RepB [unclassified Mesorhizobium]MBZ9856403.1 plasmid partitioning protein RepB [Mesorhizobium sp. CA13]MCA0011967.1 plasmid partitioning protein RepB [Mesorhizobium sp. B294B1A1]MCA0038221.1 plasmid partitioning protein RepB [Mesorhizobium sp. B292B1B]TPM44051.1 plasmid partitioning protein RepB [Mesorhizobium sp. B2-3-2]